MLFLLLSPDVPTGWNEILQMIYESEMQREHSGRISFDFIYLVLLGRKT